MGKNGLASAAGVLIGAAYTAVGIIGFAITGFGNFVQDTGDHLLFGASINPMHNLVHVAIGLFLIIMTTRFTTATAEGALMGVGLFYIVAFVIGVIAPDNLTIISMNGAGDGENFIHIITGVTALTAGLIAAGQSEAAAKKSGIPAS
jgi:hypothetical protein